MSTGYLLIGHGTRNPAGRAEFLQLAEEVRHAADDLLLEPAFLELAEPTIEEAIGQLSRQGVEEIICSPVILLAAAHVKRDIPAAVREAAKRAGIESVRFTAHLGCRQALLELSLLRYRQATERLRPEGSSGWVLVGRGTHDKEALSEIRQFQTMREALCSTSQQWLGFLAMAEPKLPEVLEHAAGSEVSAVIVQPHLMFQGDLLTRTAETVADFARRYPHKKWILADHLGPHDLLATSLAGELLAAGKRQS